MKLEALTTRVIVERIEVDRTTASGIVLQSDTEVPCARVLAVGPDVRGIAVDDRLHVDWRHTAAFKIAGRTYFTVDQQNIMAIERP